MHDTNKILEKKSTYFNASYKIRKNIKYDVKDDYNEYLLNSLNFRCDEIDSKKDLLFSGCSFTFGVGVPKNGIWTTIVANNLNVEYHNLGAPGKSVPWIINNLFNYFKLYGNPKTLICLFPNFTRLHVISNAQHMTTKQIINDEYNLEDVKMYDIDLQNLYLNMPKFSKKIHLAEDIMPVEFAIYTAIEHIKMLELYCKASGIKFLWSTWAWEEHKFLSNNLNITKFENFIKLDINKWHSKFSDKFYDRYHDSEKIFETCHKEEKCLLYKDCHKDMRNYYGENFDLSSDFRSTAGTHHWGVHKHIHIAESFLKEIKEIF